MRSLILLTLLLGPALAQEDWPTRYEAATQRLEAGDFATAAEGLEALLADAPDEASRARVRVLRDLARLWAERGVVLVRSQDAGDDRLSAKAAGERTTDELVLLYLMSVSYGLGTGVWFDIMAESNSPSSVVLPPLLLAGAAAGGVAALDARGEKLRYGVPQSIASGMRIGLMEGVTWTLWNQARVRVDDEWTMKTSATVVWGVTTAGMIAGGVVGHEVGTTPGRAQWVESAAMWSGIVFGLAAGTIDAEHPDDLALLTGAVALNVGAVGGMLTAGDVSPRAARVRFIDLGGLSGALVAGGLYIAIAGEDGSARPALGITAAGTAAGLATAWLFTAQMPRDETEPRSARLLLTPTEDGGGLLGLAGTG